MATLALSNKQNSTLNALWTLFIGQPKAVREAFVRKLQMEDETTKRNKKLVKDSLTLAFHELNQAKRGEIKLRDAEDLLKEL